MRKPPLIVIEPERTDVHMSLDDVLRMWSGPLASKSANKTLIYGMFPRPNRKRERPPIIDGPSIFLEVLI